MPTNTIDPSRSPKAQNEPPPSPFRVDLDKFHRIDLGTATPTLAQQAWLWTHHFGLHCVAAYRFHRYARTLAEQRPVAAQPALALARVLTYAVRVVHHVEVTAEVGPGFYIGHAGNIFIGHTRIGRNFSVTHNVTVGVGHQLTAAGIPEIGDDVWVGTGSVLAGKVQVGDGVTVASGSIVTRDLPAGALVAGNPARVIQAGYDNGRLMGVTQPANGVSTANA